MGRHGHRGSLKQGVHGALALPGLVPQPAFEKWFETWRGLKRSGSPLHSEASRTYLRCRDGGLSLGLSRRLGPKRKAPDRQAVLAPRPKILCGCTPAPTAKVLPHGLWPLAPQS